MLGLGNGAKIPDMEKQRRIFVYLAVLAGVLFVQWSVGRGAGEIFAGSLNASEDQQDTESIAVDPAPDVCAKQIAALIPCKDMIDDGLYQSIRRRTQEAMDRGATYMIYEIGTYGGLVKSGDDISKYFILEAGKDIRTVAYVTTEAISAGAMISVACQDIIMLESTTIGDCAPIIMGGELEGVEREKAESFIRAAFMRAAEANDYPAALLKSMVTRQLEIWQVKNKATGENEFFEKDFLPDDPNVYDIKNKRLVVKDDELLTLTASQAEKFGIARTVVEDLDGVLDFLAERDGVEFADEVIEFETLWSEEMVRKINSPAVMGVLVLLAMLGAYTELNTPGLGLPGAVAVICVIIIVGSKYLVGMANWVEVAVFCLGLVLLAVEIFVLPGFGVAGAAGIICIGAGLFGMLIKNPPDQVPWPTTEMDWTLLSQYFVAISIAFIAFLFSAYFLSKYLPKVEFLSGLTLSPAVKAAQIEHGVAATAPPESRKEGVSVGDAGVVTAPLRPIGSARFGDMVVDVVAEGQYLENGVEVEIIQIHGNRVVVKEKT